MIRSIKEFPRPSNLTGVRSFFGLIEQVAYTFSKAHSMHPFRQLLSSKSDFYWDENLQKAFEIAREMIADNISEGVKTYIPGLKTALVSDWSITGVGYILAQKHCQCSGISMECCRTGWKVISMGSRFLSKAEKNYSAVEGELLGLTWALERTKFWTLGNKELFIFTDHKPLIGMLTNKDFDSISNPRLSCLLEQTMRWGFVINHIPGI